MLPDGERSSGSRLVLGSCYGRNGTSCKCRRAAVDAQQSLLCAFLSGSTFKKKNPSREFFLMTKKKILSQGSRLSFYTHCQWSLLSQLISQVFNQPACLERRDFLSSQITWLHMGEKPFDEENLQGSQILFILAVLSLFDSSPRDHVGLSPGGAWKGDGANPRHTQTQQIQLPPLPRTIN